MTADRKDTPVDIDKLAAVLLEIKKIDWKRTNLYLLTKAFDKLPSDLKLDDQQLKELENKIFDNEKKDSADELIFRGLFCEYLHRTPCRENIIDRNNVGHRNFTQEAISYYLKAAELNSNLAVSCLIGLYEQRKLTQYPENVFQCIETAAKNGYSEAQSWMAKVLLSGVETWDAKGDTQLRVSNTEVAMEWAKQAEAQNDSDARRMLQSYWRKMEGYERYEKLAYYCRKGLGDHEKANLYHPAIVYHQVIQDFIDSLPNSWSTFFSVNAGFKPREAAQCLQQMIADNPQLLVTVIAQSPSDRKKDQEHVQRMDPSHHHPVVRDLIKFYTPNDDLLKQAHPAPPFDDEKKSEVDEFKAWLTICVDALNDPMLFPESKQSGVLSYLPLFKEEKYAAKKESIAKEFSQILGILNLDKSNMDSLIRADQKEPIDGEFGKIIIRLIFNADKNAVDDAQRYLIDRLNKFREVMANDKTGYYNPEYLSNLEILLNNNPRNRRESYAALQGPIEFDKEISMSKIYYLLAKVLLQHLEKTKTNTNAETRKNAAKELLLKAIGRNCLPAFELFKQQFPGNMIDIAPAAIVNAGALDLFAEAKSHHHNHNLSQAASCYRQALIKIKHNDLLQKFNILFSEHRYHPDVVYHYTLTVNNLTVNNIDASRREIFDPIRYQFQNLVFYMTDQIARLFIADISWDDMNNWNTVDGLFSDPRVKDKFLNALKEELIKKIVIMHSFFQNYAAFSPQITNIILTYLPSLNNPEALTKALDITNMPAKVPPSSDNVNPAAHEAHQASLVRAQREREIKQNLARLEVCKNFIEGFRAAIGNVASDFKANADEKLMTEIKEILALVDHCKNKPDSDVMDTIKQRLINLLNNCRSNSALADACAVYNERNLRHFLETPSDLKYLSHVPYQPK